MYFFVVRGGLSGDSSYEADKKSESCCDLLAAANQNKKDEGVVLRTMPMPSLGNEAWACKICYNRWWKSLNAEKPAARKSRAATAQAAVPPPPVAAATATTATATGVAATATTATATAGSIAVVSHVSQGCAEILCARNRAYWTYQVRL